MERTREQGPPTRRDIVLSAAAGAGALLAGKVAWAQAARSPGRIDLHHHYFPPAFLDAQRNAAVRLKRPAALGAALEGWSKARTIEAMDRYGIAIGILSISTPGPWFGNIEESKRLARECNDYAAEMMREHPGRFGLFAALPLPDPEAALREIDYAFDTLHADGVAVMTSYATSAGTTWPGDASLAPVFAELNRRRAAAFLPSRARRLIAAVLRQCCFRRAGCNDGDAARNDAGDHEPPVQWHAVAQSGYPLHLYQCRRHGADAFGPDRRGDQAPWRRVR
jgi:predicted TIM-barrel fold metal-dependent hydrolase